MHEYSIIAALVDQVETQLSARGASQAKRVIVSIGELSGVDPGLLASAYEVFRERTVCESADLEIRNVAAVWKCPSCARAIEKGSILRCADCGTPGRLESGDEIILERIEMEVA